MLSGVAQISSGPPAPSSGETSFGVVAEIGGPALSGGPTWFGEPLAAMANSNAGLPGRVKWYANGVILSGSLVLGAAIYNAAWPNPRRFLVYLALTLVSSMLKFRLPG